MLSKQFTVYFLKDLGMMFSCYFGVFFSFVVV